MSPRLSEHWRGRTQEASVSGVQIARRLVRGQGRQAEAKSTMVDHDKELGLPKS